MPFRRRIKSDNMDDLKVLIERARHNLKNAPENKKALYAAKLQELLATQERNS